MPEIMAILLAGGIMLGAASQKGKSVTLHWLRIGSIGALACAGLAIFLHSRSTAVRQPFAHPTVFAAFAAILLQLIGTQMSRRSLQRWAALAAFALALLTATQWLEDRAAIVAGASPVTAGVIVSAAGFSIVTGLAVMELFLAHAYLVSSRMTMHPLRRMNGLLAAALLLRGLLATAGVALLQARHPVPELWPHYWPAASARWVLGIALALASVWLASVFIRRRALQNVTAVLYISCLLILPGEMLGLYLATRTGLPF